MIILTYLIPGHFIVKAQDSFGDILSSTLRTDSLPHYVVVVLFGLLITLGIIGVEDLLIKNFSPIISKIISLVAKEFSFNL